MLRHPAHNAPLGRLVIGWLAIVLGLAGMVHVTHGTPQLTDGASLMEEGGGWLGFVGAAPLTAAVTGVVAVPLLMLLLGFGVLVVTGTPIHQIPERVTGLLDRVLNRPVRRGSGRRHRRGHVRSTEPYVSRRRPARRRRAVRQRARHRRGEPGRDAAPATPVVDTGGVTGDGVDVTATVEAPQDGALASDTHAPTLPTEPLPAASSSSPSPAT